MDRLAAERRSPTSSECLHRFLHDAGKRLETTTMKSIAGTTAVPFEYNGYREEDGLSSAFDTDTDSTHSEGIVERQATRVPHVYLADNPRRWASTFDLRPAVPAACPPSLEPLRSPELPRPASVASLLPIQRHPLEDDYRDDKVPDQPPGINPNIGAKDATLTSIPDASPLVSRGSPGVSGMHELNMSIGNVFELRLCTKTPTRLEIKEL